MHPEVTMGTPFVPAPLVVVVRAMTDAPQGGVDNDAIFAGQGFFEAQCNATTVVGQCVFADSTDDFVSPCDESSPEPCIGFVVSKQGDTRCTVQRFGESAISFDGLTPGKRYFVGPQGSIIAPPFDDEMPEYVQQVGNALSTTQLFIQPTGKVTRRIINRDFVLQAGSGDPARSTSYPRTDLYIQTDGPEGPLAYLSPTIEGEDSVILVGQGPPSAETVSDAQAVYRDSAGNLYFADGSGSPTGDISALIFGQSAPTSATVPDNNVFYLEQDEGLDTFGRTAVTGVS